MTLHSHWGHQAIRQSLVRARVQGSLPHALLIHGPRGVGKQHLALWLGQLLLCPEPSPEGPCGECSHCRLAVKLEHPDIHWYFPLPRPKGSSSPEKLARDLEHARAEALQEIRRDPLSPDHGEEPRALYLAAARTLRRHAHRRPSMGPRQVFVIAQAEALAPQGTSSEAANALLKLLEEPPDDTSLVLTSGEPGRLLPTILSRTAHLHLPPLSVAMVTDFLREVVGAPEEEARRAGALSRGSIGRALGFLPDDGDPGPLDRLRREARDLLTAALAPTSTEMFRKALSFRPAGARGLMSLLDFLEEQLRELAMMATRRGSGTVALHSDPGDEEPFREILRRWPVQAPSVAEAVHRVEEARRLASGNVNPQLLIHGLLHEIRGILTTGALSPSQKG